MISENVHIDECEMKTLSRRRTGKGNYDPKTDKEVNGYVSATYELRLHDAIKFVHEMA